MATDYEELARQAAANAANGAGDGSSSAGQPTSVSDVRPVRVGAAPSGGYSGIPLTTNTVSVFDVRQQLSNWRVNDPKQYATIVEQMRYANYLGPKSKSMAAIEEAWKNVASDAASAYADNPYSKRANVFDFLYSRAVAGAKDGPAPGSGPGSSNGGGGGSTAYTGPTYRATLTNEGDAHTILNNALFAYLGRQATPKELANFKAKLNEQELGNPAVATPQGVAGVVQSGGVNAQDEARSFAVGQNDYAETQASTTLMGWLSDAVKNSKSERIV